tara:strand:+ start:546 stop:1142 length:597 start_codon:yes stop_codon:yes gene_type:complete
MGVIMKKLKLLIQDKGLIRILVLTLGLLLIPLIAMQVSDSSEVNWSLFDFIFMFVLLFFTQLAFLLVSRRVNNLAYKAAVGIALLLAFLLVWINGAVGIIGNEGNPANLMYFAVILVGVIGAILSRLQAPGMAITLCAAACAQILVALLAWMGDGFGAQSPDWFRDVLGVSCFFALLMLLSAYLFLVAARRQAQATST